MPNAITITGFKELEEKIKKLPANLEKRMGDIVFHAAQTWSQGAKQAAPKNQGRLANEIQPVRKSSLRSEVVANNEYAHIMEWGSKSRVKVPSELQAYAATFRGKPTGGTLQQFFLSILEWVDKKGVNGRYSVKTRRRLGNANVRAYEDYDIAWAIVFSILRKGVKPQPFFFIQRPKVEKQFLDDLKQVLKNID